MVCLYCKAPTQVINSRRQKQLNQVWRRRQCTACGAVFTSHETFDFSASLALQTPDGKLAPFKKEKLFLSILKSCKHRKSALDDAIALTGTVMGKLAKVASGGALAAETVANIAHDTLRNFDHAAAVQYAAYHSDYAYAKLR
ncbi:MAG TPA: hypothetical protein VGG13_02950 [Candidatus Saccharimonadales bacterium]|jgi:transcriptional repressor NrdR